MQTYYNTITNLKPEKNLKNKYKTAEELNDKTEEKMVTSTSSSHNLLAVFFQMFEHGNEID